MTSLVATLGGGEGCNLAYKEAWTQVSGDVGLWASALKMTLTLFIPSTKQNNLSHPQPCPTFTVRASKKITQPLSAASIGWKEVARKTEVKI